MFSGRVSLGPAHIVTEWGQAASRRGHGGREGDQTRFPEFFTVNIRNPNTRAAYSPAAVEFLCWCEAWRDRCVGEVRPVHVAACVEQLGRRSRAFGQAVSRLYPNAVDWLVTGQVLTLI